jgi:hypothetical protein
MVDFIGIGAQKSGTSWIAECLAEHPEVCMARDQYGGLLKEVHFFDWNYDRGFRYYEQHFDQCRSNEVNGEFTPMYLYDEAVAERIYQYNPNVRLLVCLRNPVDRAWSQYQAGKAGWSGRTFWEVAERQPEIIERGYYARQLKCYLRFFPQDQIHVCFYDDLKEEPQRFMQQIYAFLGVDDGYIPAQLAERSNATQKIEFRYPLIERCRQTVRTMSYRTPAVHAALRTLRLGKFERMLSKWNTRPADRIGEGVPAEIREELVSHYRDDIAELEQLVGRELPQWKLTI